MNGGPKGGGGRDGRQDNNCIASAKPSWLVADECQFESKYKKINACSAVYR